MKKKYRVMCVKYGYAVVEAEAEIDAKNAAAKLRDVFFDWTEADDFQVIEEIDY